MRSSLILSLALASVAGVGAARGASPSAAGARDLVAVRAGTVYLVEGDTVVENGTILVQGSRILAVGADVDVPADARIVDYGPEAVIVPGLVAASSPYAQGRPSERTASPDLRGVDGFDFYAPYTSGLTGGVTTAYVTPAEGRLIAGVGGVVKLAGASREERLLDADAAIHGAIDASARRTRDYWEPPIPATSDVGIGEPLPQLPRTTAGAIVALEELLAAARSRASDSPYGPYVGEELGKLVGAGVPWRIGAVQEDEIRALLRFAREAQVPLILDKALEADRVVDELVASGTPVIFQLPYDPARPAEDHGKERDAIWPSFDVPARLAARGVRVAIACENPSDLLFAAQLASRGGLDEATALRAITLAPAEMLGVAERVGSLRAGKDADFVVLSGDPLTAGVGVLDTWIGGSSRWSVTSSGPAAAARGSRQAGAARLEPPTVLVADELHVGDGEVLRPGEILLQDGRIAEVGPSVGRPRGARVVRGKALMPGMIDALGHLGLEGSKRTPGADFKLRQIVDPGDHVDRRVAASGVTTVVLSPRKSSKEGAPMMAYKPAATDFERQIVGDPVALLMTWTDKNRAESGKDVRKVLEKAKEYDQKWREYEKELAEWTPPAEVPEEAAAAADEEADKEDEKASEDDSKSEESDKDSGKKKKGKKKDEEAVLEPDPVTGVWEASLERPPRPEPVSLKLRIELEPHMGSGRVWGNLRSAAVSATLVGVEGQWDREARELTLTGLGDQGWVDLVAKLEGEKLVGTLEVGGTELALEATRSSKEFVVAGRSARPRPEEAEKEQEPKGKPKAPRQDDGLEPLRAAFAGRATVVVEVEREDEILACVDTFEGYGIRPVLYGAGDAYLVKDRLRGRVAGILPSPRVVQYDPERGTDYRVPYAELQRAGIPVAFHSAAEEGAVDIPLRAAYAVANGMSPAGALRALTADAARMFAVDGRVGRLAVGMDADVLLLDGPPLDPRSSVVGAWVAGVEIKEEP